MNKEAKKLNKITLLNRQPTLFRHGLVGIDIVPCEDDEDDTIKLSPLVLSAFNADFDGDQMNLFCIHDQEALKEIEQNAHIRNTFKYDSDSTMLSTPRHETLQACYSLTEYVKPNINKEILKINNLNELPEDFDYWNDELDKPIEFNNNLYSYGICLLNKWMKFNEIKINYNITKKNINDACEILYNIDKDNYYNTLREFNNKLFFFISSTKHCPTINVNEMISILDDDSERLFKKLPKHNPYIGYSINEALVDKCIENLNHHSDLYKMYKAGSRFSKSQLARTCINIGYVADAENIVINEPICANLMTGLTEEEYFQASPGSRKGIVDKSDVTPDSGYLERTLTMALSPIEIDLDDCNTNTYIEFIVFSLNHAKTLVGKYYKDPLKNMMEWEVLDFNTAKSFINRKISIRSPITCINPNFKICKKCFGEKELPTKYVGVLSGQIVSERITQLIMRLTQLASIVSNNYLKSL
jgi:DNA-directed RNA polymerase subunit beta'